MMKLSFARGGGGDDAIPPNSETSNKVLLDAEESASTPPATTLLDAATVGAIRSGTFLAVSDDTPLPLAPLEVTEKSSRPAALMPALLQWMLPLRVWSAVAAIAAGLFQWMRALPLWSSAAAIVADPLRPLRIRVAGIAGFAGYLLSLRPSWVESLPRPFRCAPPRSFGGDSAVLAAKRGERPPTGGGGGGGGGGGTSSTAASGAEEPSESDPPTSAPSAIREPIIPALLATGSAIYMMIHKAPAPAPALMMSKLFLVSVLLASVAVVKAERVIYSPHKKADDTANEHAIDVARPNDHQMEETQKKGEETVGKLIRYYLFRTLIEASFVFHNV